MQLLDIPTSDSGLVEIVKFVVKLAFLYFFLSRLKDRVLQLLGGSGIKASASHILVSSEAQCQALKRELDAGANFGELAKKHSKCPSGKNGGHLGSFSPGCMVRYIQFLMLCTKSTMSDIDYRAMSRLSNLIALYLLRSLYYACVVLVEQPSPVINRCVNARSLPSTKWCLIQRAQLALCMAP